MKHTTMSSAFTLLLALMLMMVSSACEHRPLIDPANRHFLRVYFDEHIRNVTYGFYDRAQQDSGCTVPKVMRIALYNPSSGKQVYEGYLQKSGHDAKGNYVEGYIPVSEGVYHMLMNRFDGTSTHLRNEYQYQDAQVYTNPVSKYVMDNLQSTRDGATMLEGNILYEPDHYFVKSAEFVKITNAIDVDTLRTTSGDYYTAQSVVKTYYLQVNIKGAEYVSSASGYLTGLAGSVYLSNGALNAQDESCIYFPLKSNHIAKRSEIAQAYTTFNTFGKLPNSNGTLTVVFEFKTNYGTVQVEKIELNELFETDMVKNNQWIIIDKVIEIEPNPQSGGMQPSVGDWGTVNGELTI